MLLGFVLDLKNGVLSKYLTIQRFQKSDSGKYSETCKQISICT